MLKSQDVVSAYKLLLGREPESAAVVENYVLHSDFDQLRQTLLGSGEFAERLSRHPGMLSVPMAALTTTDEVRRYQDLLGDLVGLGLPIWDRSVLIVGDEASNLAGFFLDRQCKVAVAACEDTVALLRRLLAGRQLQAANTSFLALDFSTPFDEDLKHHDLVYGALPDDSSDAMRTWLDNAAEVCGDTLIVTACTTPGRSEDVFLTPVARKTERFRTVPTKKWLLERLRERFAHAYEPVNAAQTNAFLQNGSAGSGEAQVTLVASKSAADSQALREYVGDAPRLRHLTNGAVPAANGMVPGP